MKPSTTTKTNKIFFVHPSLLGGGAERVAISLGSYFVNHGYDFSFLLTKSKERKYEVPNGIKVIEQHADWDMSPISQIKLIRKYMKGRPDAAFISFLPHQNMYTLLASIGLSNQVIISVRNDPRYDFPGNRLLPIVRNMLYTRADSIVFQTNEQRKLLPAFLRGKGPQILNPLSSLIPDPYEGQRRNAIVTSGRLEKQKNHEMTIRAFAKFHKEHPQYTLEIFGEGTQFGFLKSLVEDCGISNSVSFRGFSPDSIEHVRTCAAFVMSSRFEGLSNAMLESLCMGVPTVCTRCGGGGSEAVIVDGLNGMLIDVDDVDGEAAALEKIVDDPHFSLGISKEASKLKDQLSLESVGAHWEGLLR